MNPLHIQVIIGSTRPQRYGDKPAHWLHGLLAAHEGVKAELVDLRDYPLPFYDAQVPPARANKQYANEVVQRWSQKVDAADGYVFTVAEYNHGYTAVLKNALDVLFPEWARKPVGFIGYGGAGGARAIEQLRQVAVELHMAPIQAAVHLPGDIFASTRTLEAPADPAHFAPAQPRAAAMIEQLLWWARTLKAGREQA